MLKTGTTPRKPELLAPAGSPEALRAALDAGADAVYLGVGAFNARRNATNFDYDSLAEACDRAHLAGRRIYFTLNTLILPDEMNEALDVAIQAWRRGVDALIIQDRGLLAVIHDRFPEIELHASTQMGIHDAEGVRVAHAEGISRVTLAREMSLTEISQATATGIDIEVFVHGALCVCYSGQCLMSSMIGGRSANRGLCAQPCRLPYALMDTSTHKRFSQEGDYSMSTRDLCAIDLLPELIMAQVSSLKIEGRMKSPEYVAVVTDVYRRALDRAYEAVCAGTPESFSVTSDERTDLAEAFSRGFTTAYMEGQRGNEMMSSKRPNNRGMQVGRVSGMRDGVVTLDLDTSIGAGDLLEFWTSQGRFTQEMSFIQPDPAHENSVRVIVERPVSRGDRVFRVRNAELLRKAAMRFNGRAEVGNAGIVELKAHIVIRIGEPLRVTLTRWNVDAVDEVSATSTGPVIEAARTRPLTEEDVREHIGRLGNTPYSIRAYEIELDEGAGLSFSLLHRARKEALESLEETLLAPYRDRIIRAAEKSSHAHVPAQKKGLTVAVLVSTDAAAKAARTAGADVVYQHVLGLENDLHVGEEPTLKTLSTHAVPALPNVVHDADRAEVLSFVKSRKPVMVGNYSWLKAAKDKGASPELAPSGSVTNGASLALAAEAGARKVWLSPELTCDQIAAFSSDAPVPLGIVVYGQQELMVTEHCMLMTQGPCDRQCRTCPRRKAPHLLEDRMQYRFPVRTDDAGRCHVYNAVPLDLTPFFPQIITAGITNVLIDATLLTTKEITAEVARAKRGAEIALKYGEALKKREGFTTGHFFHGVN